MAKTLSSESSYGYTWTIQPKMTGWKRPFAASHASCVAMEPFNPNFVQPALRNCPFCGMHRLVCKCHMATLRGTRHRRAAQRARSPECGHVAFAHQPMHAAEGTVPERGLDEVWIEGIDRHAGCL